MGERTRPRVLISVPSPKCLESSRWRGAIASTRGRVRSPDRYAFALPASSLPNWIP